MKRNSKLLVLLAVLLSGILGVYFIGCEGDDTTIIEPPLEDKVLGSIEGVVTDAVSNEPLPNVRVAWRPQHSDETHSVTTDSIGYFLIDDDLPSGNYVLTFTVNGYSVLREIAYIPTFEDLMGDIDETAHGPIEYRFSFGQLDLGLYPLNAGLTGKVFTALPGAPSKDSEIGLATEDPPPDFLAPAANVSVHLLFDTLYPSDWCNGYGGESPVKDNQSGQALEGPMPLNLTPREYIAVTDAEGVYSFTNLPAVTGGYLLLYTDPYQMGDTLYESEFRCVYLLPNATVTVPDIFTDIAGDCARVMSTNFETGRFALDSNLIVGFSKEIDTGTVTVYLWEDCWPWRDLSFGLTWSNENRALTIDPTFSLVPDCNYDITISGKAVDGNDLCTFWGELYTIQGMRFVSTNLDDFSGSQFTFCDFPLDSNIVICFDMAPDLTNPNTRIVLYDEEAGREIDVATSVNGNCVIIDPANPLESERHYSLDFKIYSSLSVYDYVEDWEATQTGDDLKFYAVSTDTTPGTVTGFAVYYIDEDGKADWNTTMITFRWDAVPGADKYEIYAKDNHKNTDFIRVATDTALDYVTWQTGDVDFTTSANDQFDLFEDDGIITPFSDSNEITFQIRAIAEREVCGQVAQRLEGPFSDSVSIRDETPPSFTVCVGGDADNSLGTSDMVLNFDVDGFFGQYGGDSGSGIWLEYCDTLNNPTFSFEEGGGDPAYVLTPDAVSHSWDQYMRNVSGTITVPAGKMAAADTFVVKIKDNSGNEGTVKFQLRPVIEFVSPTSTDTTFEAQQATIQWNITEAYSDTNCSGTIGVDYVDIYISWDNGATWIDTLDDEWGPTGWVYYGDEVNDTLIVDGTALIGIEDDNGGFRWLSEPFTVNGIKLTSPDSASYYAITDTILDAGNTDSTLVPMAWNSTAFISEVVISYSINGGVDWIVFDTVTNTGTYDFYPPSRGGDYASWLRVADADSDGRPRNSTSWYFVVWHDTVIIDAPQFNDIVQGGSVYDILWDNSIPIDTLPSILDIYYAVDAATDTNWVNIVTGTENDGIYTWDTVPYNSPSDYALIKIEAQDGTAYISDPFIISGLKITSPNGGEDWDVGSGQTITWDNYGGFSGNVDIEYSTDGGSNWSVIDTNVANTGSYSWDIPNSPSSQCLVRVKENGGIIQDVSDGNFTIAGIIITDPNGGERWLVGRPDTITWTVYGDIGDTVGIVFSVDNGANYNDTLTLEGITNSGLFAFNVPATLPGPFPYNQCLVRVYDRMSGGTAEDTSDAVFTIDQPHITLTAPNGGESWQMGTTQNITWDTVGLQATSLVITLDTLSGTGGYPIVIDTVSATSTSYSWTIPTYSNQITTCRIRIAEIGYPLNDESDADFTITP